MELGLPKYTWRNLNPPRLGEAPTTVPLSLTRKQRYDNPCSMLLYKELLHLHVNVVAVVLDHHHHIIIARPINLVFEE
jgi:hypothetical protein